MVDAISPKPVTGAQRISAVAAAKNVSASAPVATEQAAVSLPGGVARSLAASPPVDPERVAQIKKAVAEGTFPIVPAQVADRLIALKLEWRRNDAA